MALREQIARQTYSQTEDSVTIDEEEFEDMYPTRTPSSARRYQSPIEPMTGEDRNLNRKLTQVPPRRTVIQPENYFQGNTRLNVHQGAPPPTGKKGRTIR